ncbi:MAG: hypothetical protein R3B48_04640 [Kofleriaceae bacterium]
MPWTRPLALAAAACLLTSCSGRKDAAEGGAPPAAAVRTADPRPARSPTPSAALPPYQRHADLATAVLALLEPTTRVIGFGELHARRDRPGVPSPLPRFTAEILPALAARSGHLVLETWTVDDGCGPVAAAASASVLKAVRRPERTQDELGELVAAASARRLPTSAMRVTCDDYRALSAGGDDALLYMMELTTRELTRLAETALRAPRPGLTLIYGGAIHNDLYPTSGLEDWSYAAAVDRAAEHAYLEIDLITPELAEADPATARQPWAPLLAGRADLVSFRRGERSYVIVLPRTPPSATPPGAPP